ncbi:class I SAM-dependent methyltransferase [Actinocrispum sp. NPDC049592]|uniref:THUMP-like domain-containing protein n=1 Tax=Actinocrispum sp. NPDC049592 TaxID=3154835 RepID=UPI003413D908
MSYGFTLADIEFLTSAAGTDALAGVDALELTSATYLADVATARKLVGPNVGPVLETVLLRRKAVSKMDSPERWLFTDDALQQATPAEVAQHRAARFAGRDVHDVTCSIGMDLVYTSYTAGISVGSDLDAVRVHMARHNTGLPVLQADALRPVTRGTAILADPARRDSSGRRRWRPSDFAPPLDALADVYAGRDMAVKCAPGIDPSDVPWAREIELVSLNGSVREACLWTGSLATPGVRRRASVLRTGAEPWSITDADPDDCPVTAPSEWLIDPDGAVVRAGLVRQYAARHGLAQLDPRIAYLTGATPPAGIRAFRVVEHGRYTEKALRQELARRKVGKLEILVRGLDVDPNALRPRLRLRGAEEATVVLTRIGNTPTALLCNAVRTN